jgi:uncharacterized membrane protein YkvA (DUF1232 family)
VPPQPDATHPIGAAAVPWHDERVVSRAGKSPTPIIDVGDPSVGDAFWDKLRRYARVAGRTVVERALRLYYASQDPATPPWARRAIYAGLAYFLVPFDFVPDFIPAVGYTDDAATLLATLAFVSVYVGKDIKIRAAAKTAEWFG